MWVGGWVGVGLLVLSLDPPLTRQTLVRALPPPLVAAIPITRCSWLYLAWRWRSSWSRWVSLCRLGRTSETPYVHGCVVSVVCVDSVTLCGLRGVFGHMAEVHDSVRVRMLRAWYERGMSVV